MFLARALAQEGQVILLDEPFTGVDVTTEEAIVRLLTELRDEGRVMLISTHNLGSVPEYCDHAILINRRVLCSGPTAEVFTQANLEAAFGGKLRHFVLGGPALHEDEDQARGDGADRRRAAVRDLRRQGAPRAARRGSREVIEDEWL